MKLLENRLFLALLFIPFFAFGQIESDDIRIGNRFYKDKKYTEAEIEYRKALQKNSNSFEANFNLGNSLFRQEKYKDAFEQYKKSMSSTEDKKKIASGYHNLGNTFMAGGQIQDAIAAYKMALKNNPKDDETRYNLAYAQSLLDRQQQNQENNNNKNDKDQNKNQDQQNPENEPQNEPEEKQPEQEPPRMSKENAQQILNALEQDEKDTREKAEKARSRSGRKVEKDW